MILGFTGDITVPLPLPDGVIPLPLPADVLAAPLPDNVLVAPLPSVVEFEAVLPAGDGDLVTSFFSGDGFKGNMQRCIIGVWQYSKSHLVDNIFFF